MNSTGSSRPADDTAVCLISWLDTWSTCSSFTNSQSTDGHSLLHHGTCNVKVKDRVPSKELRERLEIDDIILILQQNRLRWYGHVLRKDDTDWMKKCMEYEVKGSRPLEL